VDVVAAVGADEESAAVVQPGEGAFDDPAVSAEAGAVFDLAASDDRLDSAFPDEPPVLVVVVAAVGDQRPRSADRPRAIKRVVLPPEGDNRVRGARVEQRSVTPSDRLPRPV